MRAVFTGCAASEIAKAETQISCLPADGGRPFEFGVCDRCSNRAGTTGSGDDKNARIYEIDALVAQARTAFDSEMGSSPS